jgi:hypothetical protein
MAKEPVLEFRLSRPTLFHCSSCGNHQDEGAFVPRGEIEQLIEAFADHVRRYHSAGEDFSQAAARIVREATEK